MIALGLLIECALGDLGAEAELEVEEHILSCGRCAALYASLVRLGMELSAFVRAGEVMMLITGALAERLEREGLVTRRYVLSPGTVVPCRVAAEDVYSLTTLHADLSQEERVDLVQGGQRIPDVPFDRAGVRLLSSSDVLRKLPTMRLPFQLIAVDGEGRDRIIAEYTLDHTAVGPEADG